MPLDLDRARRKRLGDRYESVANAKETLYGNRDSNPDTTAVALPYAQEKKIPVDMAERNIDELKKEKQLREQDVVLMNNPQLASWLGYQDNARVAHDDMPFLDRVGKTITDIPKALQEGQTDLTLGVLRDKQLYGNASDKEIELANTLSARNRPENLGTGGWFSGGVIAIAEQIPNTAYTAKESLLYGGAAAGAVTLAGQLGPQVATPEEIVTVPTAFTAGSIVGAFNASRKIEGGMAYDEFLQVKDEAGQSIDPDVARGAAMMVGIINGGLELVPLEKLVKTVPGIEKFTGMMTKEGMKKALRYPGVRDALGKVAKNYAQLIFAEGSTEAAQEAFTIVGGEIAKANINCA